MHDGGWTCKAETIIGKDMLERLYVDQSRFVLWEITTPKDLKRGKTSEKKVVVVKEKPVEVDDKNLWRLRRLSSPTLITPIPARPTSASPILSRPSSRPPISRPVSPHPHHFDHPEKHSGGSGWSGSLTSLLGGRAISPGDFGQRGGSGGKTRNGTGVRIETRNGTGLRTGTGKLERGISGVTIDRMDRGVTGDRMDRGVTGDRKDRLFAGTATVSGTIAGTLTAGTTATRRNVRFGGPSPLHSAILTYDKVWGLGRLFKVALKGTIRQENDHQITALPTHKKKGC